MALITYLKFPVLKGGGDMKTPKAKDREEKYICIGENFRRDIPIGDVGDTRTLWEWLRHFLPEQTEEELKAHFNENWTNKQIVAFCYDSLGKRLEKI